MTKALRLFACLALVGTAASGCMATQDDIDQAELDEQGALGSTDQGEVASTEQALLRGGSNHQTLGYSCTPGGSCTCDKSIENDCEDMSGVCADKDIDQLINCINGWLTTHCTCAKASAFVAPTIKNTAVLGKTTTATFSLAR